MSHSSAAFREAQIQVHRTIFKRYADYILMMIEHNPEATAFVQIVPRFQIILIRYYFFICIWAEVSRSRFYKRFVIQILDSTCIHSKMCVRLSALDPVVNGVNEFLGRMYMFIDMMTTDVYIGKYICNIVCFTPEHRMESLFIDHFGLFIFFFNKIYYYLVVWHKNYLSTFFCISNLFAGFLCCFSYTPCSRSRKTAPT